MVLAGIPDGTRSPADGLAGIDRHDRDGVLVVLHIFRREMRSRWEDLPGVPVIPAGAGGPVDGPALCPDAGNQTLIIPPANDGYDKT
jgi:hypothetical protein